MFDTKMNLFDVTLTSGIRSLNKIPTEVKLSMLDKIISKGIKRLEITSFENGAQFEDRDDLIKQLPKGPMYYGSVINPHGYDLLRRYPTIKGLSMSISSVQAYKDMNVGKQCFRDVGYVLRDKSIRSRVYLNTDENIDIPNVYYVPMLVKKLLMMGSDEVILTDDVGNDVLEELKIFNKNIGIKIRRVGIQGNKPDDFSKKGFNKFDVSLLRGDDKHTLLGHEWFEPI